ncbi:hypothetical protein F5888DRAFT_1909701 [Russula emetica]|nr:hypothetical protein F5888DRAFT_1909701 [Russula emetica]
MSRSSDIFQSVPAPGQALILLRRTTSDSGTGVQLLFATPLQRTTPKYHYPVSRFAKLDTGDTQRIDILRPPSAAKSLSLGSMHIVPPVALVLKQVIEEGMTDVLPAIQKLSVSRSLPAGPVREAIEQFVAGRGLPAFEKPAFSEWRFSAQDANDG